MKNRFANKDFMSHFQAFKNKQNIFFAFGLLLVFMGCMRFNNEKNWPQQKFSNQETNDPNLDQGNQSGDPNAPGAGELTVGPVTIEATDEEKRNLESSISTLLEYGLNGKDIRDLVSFLKQSGQQPYVTRNGSSETGSLYFVRTQNPPKGTRYFHAQYMSDENGKLYAQHISFEFRPGLDSFELAKETLKSLYPNLGSPKAGRNTKEITSWKLENGMHAYIKTLSKDEILEGHPYNAYSIEDEGTIQVAIEVDIHGEEEGHGHSH